MLRISSLTSPWNSLLKSSDLIKADAWFQRRLQHPLTKPNSILLAPGDHRIAGHWGNHLRKAVECCGALCRTGAIAHWVRDRTRTRRQTHTCHQPRRSILQRAIRGLWAPLRSETALPSDWPGESGRWGFEGTITLVTTRKYNHDVHSTKTELATWP